MRLSCPLPLRSLALAAAVAGCAPDLPTPVLERVSPARGWTGEDTDVAVIGSRFYPEIRVAGDAPIGVERSFSLALQPHGAPEAAPTSLRDVVLVGFDQLTARVPAGMDPGRYDLLLGSPEGDAATLAEAFTVTATQADRIDVATAAINLVVGEYASIALQVRDPEGDEVPQPVSVRVTVETDSGSVRGVDLRTGMDGASDFENGVLEGKLGDGGRATLLLSSSTVDRLRLRVEGLGADDYLQGTSEWIDFRPLNVAKLELEVPDAAAGTTAGAALDLEVRLLDADGNPTRGELVWVSLRESCPGITGAFERLVAVEDAATIQDAFLTGATDGERCRSNRFEALATVGATALSDRSDDVFVRAADAADYDVELGAASVEAGGSPLPLWVVARDPFGNRVTDHSATLSLRDDRGGLDTSAGVGTGSCAAFVGGASACTAGPTVASDVVRVQAVDSRGRSGWSTAFAVTPGPVAELSVSLDETSVAAGAATDVALQGRDAYGNGVEMGLLVGNAPVFHDLGGTVRCRAGRMGSATGESLWPCTFTAARPDEQLTVTTALSGHSGSSAPFVVTNGPLAAVEVDVGGVTSLVAGDELGWALQATDAWGNPYETGAVSSLDLLDVGGELAPAAVPLSAAGQASGTVLLTRAIDENRLLFQSGGAALGVSTPFAVTHDAHADYTLTLPASWIELGSEAELSVEAIDQWGNLVVDHAATLGLSGDLGLVASATTSAFTDGQATLPIDTVLTGTGERLAVDDGSVQAQTGPFDVVAFDCAAGPTGSLLLDGTTERVLCLVSGSTPMVGVSASASAAGGVPLAAYHLGEGGTGWLRSTNPLGSLRWTTEGAHEVGLVVVDEDGCADRASAMAWVGANDGEPVGPLALALGTASLSSASAATGGQTTVDLVATDCAGDPASGGTLLVRAELGTLSSAGSTLSATGAGLAVVLDSSGAAELSWSVQGAGLATTAQVHAGVATGAAHGAVAAEITGDETRPRVVEWSPQGATAATVSTLEVQFSEPLWAATVDSSRVTLEDELGNPVALDSLTLSDDGRRLSLTPVDPVDASNGAHALVLDAALRDDAGNRLDGLWDGSASDAALWFGDVVESAPAVTGCTPSTATFRPDGDAGTGPEADLVAVAAVADSLPTWWRLDVRDADGERVAQRVHPATAAAELLSWDGREDGGGIVENGVYTVVVDALDDNPAPGVGCGFTVRIDNVARPPE